MELYYTHNKFFCSPLSGYETKIFPECKNNNPLILQHADLKPSVLTADKVSADLIPIVRHWIDNFITPVLHSNLPNFIQDPALLKDATNQNKYTQRLRSQLPIAAAAHSLNMMLAKRIPLSPSDKNSPSFVSSLNDEIESRHLNPEWHSVISQTTDNLDLSKEQLKVLALLSYQVGELNSRLERLELLNASLVTTMVNQQEILSEILKNAKQRK